MEQLLTAFVTVIVSVLASSGFWAYLTTKFDKKSASANLLRGLASDRIVYLGMKYIHRGWITRNEYDDLIQNIYVPYKAMGGNGLAEQVVRNINALPFKQPTFEDDEDGDGA